jgi:hypothetical protein
MGNAIDIGPAMTCKVVTANDEVVYCSTVRSLTSDELMDKTHKKAREYFTSSIYKKLGESFKFEDFSMDPELEDLGTLIYKSYEDDVDEGPRFVPDAEDVDVDTYNQYVGAEVSLPIIGDSVLTAKVCGRKRESDGTLRNKANPNPILDRRTYEVEFSDGQRTKVAPNIIAQNMYAQCNSEGNQYLLLGRIVDHKETNRP